MSRSPESKFISHAQRSYYSALPGGGGAVYLCRLRFAVPLEVRRGRRQSGSSGPPTWTSAPSPSTTGHAAGLQEGPRATCASATPTTEPITTELTPEVWATEPGITVTWTTSAASCPAVLWRERKSDLPKEAGREK